MTKLKTFWHVFTNSLIPNTSYYHKILKSPFSFSLKYFLTLIVILNLLFGAFLALKLNPWKIHETFQSLVSSLDEFPNNLTISVKDGVLMTNYNKPYFLWFDYKDSKRLLLVIDETATAEKIYEYRSDMLLTRGELVIRNPKDTSEIQILNLSYVNQQTINKDIILKVQEYIREITRFILLSYPLLLILTMIFLVLASFFSTALYLVIASAVVYIFYLFFLRKKTQPTFKNAFQISLHSITTPLLLNYVLGMFYLGIPLLPFFFLFLIVVFTFAGIYDAHLHNTNHHRRE
ncbi:DUF1189 family protein [Candidatus Roizmanbacteria bacterium]|nr:DUF1189 family protein [Candidatus Roizmanbacteria bacterium]